MEDSGMSEFKGTKGLRTVVERGEWWDVVDENNDRISSFDKSDNRSQYDALLDSCAPEMLDMLQEIADKFDKDQHLLNVSPSKIKRLIKKATTI